MTFTQAQNYLEQRFSSKGTYSLDRMYTLLANLNSPHLTVPTIHVGGTAGKGSTSYLIAAMLEQTGYRVGLYTSPHLVSITERIMINRTPISEPDFVSLLESIKRAIPAGATYFELITAMAFAYFAQNNVDVGVIEVGIGGKLDATNVVDPLVCVLTNVGLDHTEILGNTIEAIARDKREIIKPGKPVVCGVTQESLRRLIRQKAKITHAPLFLLNRDFHIEHASLETFDYVSPKNVYRGLKLAMLGMHQKVNASLAITAVLKSGLNVKEAHVRHALAYTKFPGRMEIKHGIIIDGAHNPMKIQALAQALSDHFPGKKFETLFAVKGDKNCAEMVRILAPHVSHWHLTTLVAKTDWGRGMMMPMKKLKTIVQITDPDKPISLVSNIGTLLKQPPHPLLVTGSLYLVGAVETFFSKI